MAVEQGKANNFISREIEVTERLINVINDFTELRTEWDAQAYASEITDADIAGDNEHVTAADLANAFNTHAAIKTLMEAGHWTNLYRLKR